MCRTGRRDRCPSCRQLRAAPARSGAPAFAAELAAHAVRVTPPADVATRVRRQFVAILHRAAAGDRAMALADTDALVAALPAGPARAEAVSLRVAIDFAGGDRYLEQALAEAGTDELLRGRILELRGWMAMTYRAELDAPGSGSANRRSRSPSDCTIRGSRCWPPARWRPPA